MRMTNLSLEKHNDLDSTQPMVLGGLSILNKAKRAETTTAAPVINFIVGCFSLEYTGPSGRTSLLCACTTNSSMTLGLLLNRHANVHATDHFGRGALHSALYVRTYIICPNDCMTSKHEAHHQCACPAELDHHDCHYIHSWRECPRSNKLGLEDTIRILLEHGCDPNLLDIYGYSPTDYAQRQEDLHLIWRTALDNAGYTWHSSFREWRRTTPTWYIGSETDVALSGWNGYAAELLAI